MYIVYTEYSTFASIFHPPSHGSPFRAALAGVGGGIGQSPRTSTDYGRSGRPRMALTHQH
ncbi:uncharacterized protein P884DRAFT_263291 [Thermothelomyces heterothallicus CBS 202.75]|uniref:uncharacterized protein n=1 Tax=Thermothelomyces heterothallicus CBS 202.75 TaxID=1149848 RepID=UPI0037448A42